MAFASLYVPDFLIQAAVRAETELRGRAIALIDGTPPLQTVVAANETARQCGIEIGMPKSQAADFPVEIRVRSQAKEKTAHAALLDLGWSVSPRVEDTAADTIVVDLAGLGALLGSEETMARQLLQGAAELGMGVNVAVASNIETAVAASRGFSGMMVIAPGEESQRVGLLSVSALGPSVEALETLARWGIHTCGVLAALSVLELSERLGQEGVRLHELARGVGVRSLVLAQPEFSFEEALELDDSVEELEPLAFLLGRLLDQLCARLAARSLAAAVVRLQLQLEPSPEVEVQVWNEKSRQEISPTVFEKALHLPVPMRDSKMLLRLLRLQLQADSPKAPVANIFIAADAARPRTAQQGLFVPAGPDPEKLELTIARIASVVGDANVGSPEVLPTHRPDEFRIKRFLPQQASDIRRRAPRENERALQALAASHADQQSAARDRQSFTPSDACFRVFRPSAPARVDLRDGRPARIRFNGLRGDIVTASGPWRASGDWWREDPWHDDEWDVEIRFGSSSAASISSSPGRQQKPLQKSFPLWAHELWGAAEPRPACGLYRIYYDSIRQSWFVRGMYD